MKKWLIGVCSTIIVVPALVLSWKNVQAVWNTPEKIAEIEEVNAQQQEINVQQQAITEKLDRAYELNTQQWQQQTIEDQRQWEIMKALLEKKK